MRDIYRDFRKYSQSLLSSEQSRRTITISGPTPLALVYPNSYATGMSSLGFQTVYRLLNEQPLFHCERVFVYENPFAFYPYTLEGQKSLRNYRIIAFSNSYELDYPNVLKLLRAAGIPLLAQDRTELDPLIIMGGVTAFYNPSVLAPVADVMFIGEAEPLVPVFNEIYRQHLHQGGSKDALLLQLAQMPGFYLPQIHGLSPVDKKIERRYWPIESAEPATSCCISKHMHMHMFLVEVGRGCGRGCRFCTAGHVYRPHRYWPIDAILNAVASHAGPGDRVGLVGAALSDFKGLDQLCGKLLTQGHTIGLSSLRADRITPALLRALAHSDISSVTIAPEAGSEALRRLLHKNLSDEDIMFSVDLIARSHISSLKLYFMIGLPSEKDTDLDAIAALIRKTADVFLRGSGKRELRVSINTFVPKPWTPFQWAAMATEKEIKLKRKYLYRALQSIPGLIISRKSARDELLQAILSIGGPEVGLDLVQRIRQQRDWSRLYADWSDWLYAEKTQHQVFPWDFIDCGIDKKRLYNNWRAAKGDRG
ncbi:radical SAM protein [candidate division KSB1 bacterium]|nr:radical SAM protein [candidate division KSB1 bacterium]